MTPALPVDVEAAITWAVEAAERRMTGGEDDYARDTERLDAAEATLRAAIAAHVLTPERRAFYEAARRYAAYPYRFPSDRGNIIGADRRAFALAYDAMLAAEARALLPAPSTTTPQEEAKEAR